MKQCSYTAQKRDELIIRIITEEISQEERDSFYDHLTHCEACRDRFEKTKELTNKLIGISRPSPLTPIEMALLNRLIKESPSLHRKFLPINILLKTTMAIAFTLVLIFTGWEIQRKLPLNNPNINKEIFSKEDMDLIDNLEMLKELETIEKLVKTLNKNSENHS
ncbi:MAG: hypothetical protein N2260_02230 [Syntrophobacterales bacterium]|nr:hypothetical protein [Syntrophobacterales bacterium]